MLQINIDIVSIRPETSGHLNQLILLIVVEVSIAPSCPAMTSSTEESTCPTRHTAPQWLRALDIATRSFLGAAASPRSPTPSMSSDAERSSEVMKREGSTGKTWRASRGYDMEEGEGVEASRDRE